VSVGTSPTGERKVTEYDLLCAVSVTRVTTGDPSGPTREFSAVCTPLAVSGKGSDAATAVPRVIVPDVLPGADLVYWTLICCTSRTNSASFATVTV
jgi:hypothetical protein